MKSKIETNIEEWLNISLALDTQWGNHIHLDEIVPHRIAKAAMIKRSFEVLHKTIQMKKTMRADDLVLKLCIYLRESKRKKALHFKHVNQLKQYILYTPPSFGMLNKGDFEDFINTQRSARITYGKRTMTIYHSQHYDEEMKTFYPYIYICENDFVKAIS